MVKKQENIQFTTTPPLDFGPTEDTSKNIIKIIGVGGGGGNAVKSLYLDEVPNVTFAVCNTDSQVLSKSPVPVRIMLGNSGLGAGGNPDKGKSDAEENIDDIRRLLSDKTKMVFVTAGMGGGTGTGAAPVVAKVAKDMGLLTIGIVTIPFYFEKRRKIIKALKGVEELRKNVDALLIINNERLCDIYADSQVTVKEGFKRADKVLGDAAKSISELIFVEGDINLDFCDVETTMRGGGGAIMAMGRASGEKRIQNAILDALNSPLIYGSDIGKAKKILLNIFTSPEHPMFISEMNELDAFMEAINPDVDFIYGISDDATLGEDCKITILATGMDDEMHVEMPENMTDEDYDRLIARLYHKSVNSKKNKVEQIQMEFDEESGKETNVEQYSYTDEDDDDEEDINPQESFLAKVTRIIKEMIEEE